MLTLRQRMAHICGFLDSFTFSHFFATSCRFYNVRVGALNCRLNFRKKKKKKSNIWRLHVLASCCLANEYSEIGCFSQCALYGLMKLELLRETILLTIFLQFKVKENQKMSKGHSFEITRELLPRMLILKRRMLQKCVFPACFSCRKFFATSCRIYNVRVGALNCQENFGLKNSTFCCSDVLA